MPLCRLQLGQTADAALLPGQGGLGELVDPSCAYVPLCPATPSLSTVTWHDPSSVDGASLRSLYMNADGCAHFSPSRRVTMQNFRSSGLQIRVSAATVADGSAERSWSRVSFLRSVSPGGPHGRRQSRVGDRSGSAGSSPCREQRQPSRVTVRLAYEQPGHLEQP